MDKSFNDQELSDIMKEIEALEEDFTAQDEKLASPVMEELSELDETGPVSATSVPTAHHEEVMEEIVEEVEETPVEAPVAKQNVVSLESKRSASEEPVAKTASTGASTSMSFKVQGNLTLELQFDIGGKVVCLEVTESGLSIEMEGGMKFTVPVTETTSYKKAV